jgi:hypothetical protein
LPNLYSHRRRATRAFVLGFFRADATISSNFLAVRGLYFGTERIYIDPRLVATPFFSSACEKSFGHIAIFVYF